MHGRCQQTKTEKHETATCVPSSSLLLLLSHESTRALVQGTTARDEAADKQDQDQATRDRRVRPPLLLPLISLSCEHARSCVQEAAARDQATHERGRDRAAGDRRVSALLFSASALLSHDSTRALACRKPALRTRRCYSCRAVLVVMKPRVPKRFRCDECKRRFKARAMPTKVYKRRRN